MLAHSNKQTFGNLGNRGSKDNHRKIHKHGNWKINGNVCNPGNKGNHGNISNQSSHKYL